jgi:hypothetical protein
MNLLSAQRCKFAFAASRTTFIGSTKDIKQRRWQSQQPPSVTSTFVDIYKMPPLSTALDVLRIVKRAGIEALPDRVSLNNAHEDLQLKGPRHFVVELDSEVDAWNLIRADPQQDGWPVRMRVKPPERSVTAKRYASDHLSTVLRGEAVIIVSPLPERCTVEDVVALFEPQRVVHAELAMVRSVRFAVVHLPSPHEAHTWLMTGRRHTLAAALSSTGFATAPTFYVSPLCWGM